MTASISDVRNAYKLYTKLAKEAGFDTTGWNLVEGSKTAGVAYRSYRNGSGTPGTQIAGYLGSTKTEALEALRFINETLWSVLKLKRNGS